MKLRQTRTVSRGGFTLVELLVVIAIIAILVSLTAAAVMKLMGKGPEAQNRNDLNQLAIALGNFKAQFGAFPPSRCRICSRKNQYFQSGQPATQDKIDADSIQFLQMMFPRLGESNLWMNPNNNGQNGNGIDWGWGPQAVVDLEGEQCLVFFLGGYPTGGGGQNGCLGWSSDPVNPANPAGPRLQGSPFYDFKSDRLVAITTPLLNNPNASNLPAFVYLDAYGKQTDPKSKPFAYFSSYKSLNGYNRYGSSDCASLGVSPYFISASNINGQLVVRYHNPDTFQLISAGEDKVFGPGGQWTAGTGMNTPVNGRDDITNFHPRMLGANE